jgi:prepilin-type N-terminal cleavage/methylation domain-containing protein
MKKHATIRGFTLVEVIVSIGIFAMASFMISSGLLVLLDSQKRVADKQQIFDEFRLGAEFIEREVTIGYLFHEPENCAVAHSCLEFTVRSRPDMEPQRVSYRYDPVNKRLLRAEYRSYGPCSETPFDPNSSCYVPITADQTELALAQFTISNLTAESKPIITLTLQGTAQVGTDAPTDLTYSRTITPRILQDPGVNASADNQLPALGAVYLVSNGANYMLLDPVDPVNVPESVVTGSNVELRISATDNAGVHSIKFDNSADLSQEENLYAEPLPQAPAPWLTTQLTLVTGMMNTVTVQVFDQWGNRVSATFKLNVGGTVPPPAEITDLTIHQWCDETPGEGNFGLVNHGAVVSYNYYACRAALNGTCDPRNNPDVTRLNRSNENEGWGNVPLGYTYFATMVAVQGGKESLTYTVRQINLTTQLTCSAGSGWNLNILPRVATVNLVQQQAGSIYSVNERPIKILKVNGAGAAPASITCGFDSIRADNTPINSSIMNSVRTNSQFVSNAGGAFLTMKVPGNLPLGTLSVVIRCNQTGNASNWEIGNFLLRSRAGTSGSK